MRVVGVGSGPPVLFVPGTAGTGPYWGSLVRALDGFRCLLLDRRSDSEGRHRAMLVLSSRPGY
jgi:pimeloyl-ACP methyl ester carboxylesterase